MIGQYFLYSPALVKGLIETPVEDTTYNGRRGFLAALFFWVTLRPS